MPTRHVVREGESFVNIVYAAGFFPDTVWKHPANEALREKRPNMNILMPGDEVTIPDKAERKATGETGKTHRFRRKGIPHLFRLQVFHGEMPRAKQSYTLTVSGPELTKKVTGTTDDDGVLTALVPPGAASGLLVIGEDKQEIEILFGSLDPVEELAGVQKRLCNLGFACPVDGQPGPETTRALESFQRRFGLPVSGEADDATRAALATAHEEVGRFPKERSQ
jgi:N-acetylmuramoyl-L-alanine amidase